MLRCDCGSHGITVTGDDYGISMALWYMGMQQDTFWYRLKAVWRILKGRSYVFEEILMREEDTLTLQSMLKKSVVDYKQAMEKRQAISCTYGNTLEK
jgi:hypothetical protein